MAAKSIILNTARTRRMINYLEKMSDDGSVWFVLHRTEQWSPDPTNPDAPNNEDKWQDIVDSNIIRLVKPTTFIPVVEDPSGEYIYRGKMYKQVDSDKYYTENCYHILVRGYIDYLEDGRMYCSTTLAENVQYDKEGAFELLPEEVTNFNKDEDHDGPVCIVESNDMPTFISSDRRIQLSILIEF